MHGTMTIFRREIAGYFVSPVAYIIGAAFLVVTGLVFHNDLINALTLRPANPAVVPQFLALAMIFFAPLLTMRLLAEETKEGTLELLLTSPVRDSEIVFGKFLSAWTFYTLLLFVPLFIYPMVLQNLTVTDVSLDYGQMAAAYIGMWLYGGAALAIGLMFSAMTENQIVASFLSMSFLLIMYAGDQLIGEVVATFELANLVRKLTLTGHYLSSFAVGLFRAEDAAYYAGIIIIALFITIRIVESRRWR